MNDSIKFVDKYRQIGMVERILNLIVEWLTSLSYQSNNVSRKSFIPFGCRHKFLVRHFLLSLQSQFPKIMDWIRGVWWKIQISNFP